MAAEETPATAGSTEPTGAESPRTDEATGAEPSRTDEATGAEPSRTDEATGAEPPRTDEATGAAAPGATRSNRRKVREGLVLSVDMDKTAVIGVIERVRHPRYVKTVQRTKRLYVHDPRNDLRVGDRVRIAETRPLSKLKRWRIVDVLERAR